MTNDKPEHLLFVFIQALISFYTPGVTNAGFRKGNIQPNTTFNTFCARPRSDF